MSPNTTGALLLGWLVFGYWPDSVTRVGAAIVVLTGRFRLYRERDTGQGPDQHAEKTRLT